MEFGDFKRLLIGEPFPTSHESHERLDKIRGLAVFASDPISSNAYATEAIMHVLIVLGSGALAMTLPLGLAVATLVLLVVFSYIQTILHYPDGGGAYTVSKDNLGETPSLLAASALLIDYVLTVSVSISAGVRAVTSAFPGSPRIQSWDSITGNINNHMDKPARCSREWNSICYTNLCFCFWCSPYHRHWTGPLFRHLWG